jgi:hypothetical protein
MPSAEYYNRVIKRVLKEAAPPACSAVAWGLYVYSQKHAVVDGISAAGIAFFFVLALQGQILRVGKNVRDEDRGEEVIDHLQSMRQSIAELQRLGLATHASASSPSGIPEPPPGYIESTRTVPLGFTYFLQQAHAAIESGLSYAGVLVAAVGFEYAARRCAEQLGIDPERKGLAPIVRELGRRTENKQATETLDALNRLRNSLVHAEKETPWIDRQQALDLINAFSVGVAYLDMAA